MIPPRRLEDIEREAKRQRNIRPTVSGSKLSWKTMEGPFCAASLAGKPLPVRDWIVDELIPARAVTLFSGDGATGKSTIALQLACACVLGRPWLGRAIKSCRVAYVSCEDEKDEIHIRLNAIGSNEDWDLSDLGDLEIFDRTGRVSSIMYKPEGFNASWEPTPYWIGFRNWLIDFGAGLCVLDSLYNFFSGKQNDQVDATVFMQFLRELAIESNTAILLLQHPSKTGMETGDGTSGSVAFRNNCRGMIYLTKDKDDPKNGPLKMINLKAQYGPEMDDLMIRWEKGRFVPVAPFGYQVSSFFGRMSADQAFLACLDAANVQQRFVTHNPRVGNYAPACFEKMQQSQGFNKQDLARAMERLFANGDIANEVIGLNSSRHPKIAIVRKIKDNLGELENV